MNLKELSDQATPGPWKADPKRLVLDGQEGPIMSYLYGGRETPEGWRVSLASERVADHHFVAALVNAYRDGVVFGKTENVCCEHWCGEKSCLEVGCEEQEPQSNEAAKDK